MNRTTKMLLVIGGLALVYYLWQKSKSAGVSVTGATVSAGGTTQNLLPGTPGAVAAAGQQIGTGLTQLFQNV